MAPSIFYYNKILMLFKTHKTSPSSASFPQQLSYLKNNTKASENISKNSEYYKVMTSILDLLLNKYPSISSEMLVLKQALKKWYEHLSEQTNDRNREILRMKDDAMMNVSRDVGTVLQEIGYYLKYLTQRYQDQDLKKYYTKYLGVIKRLQWNQAETFTRDIQIQTDPQQVIISTSAHSIPTFRSIKMIHHPHSGSDITLDSLPGSFKVIEQDRYVKIKQENLQLQRKIDQMQSKVKQLQNENRQLKIEIDRIFVQNQDLNSSKEKSLQQLEKLKQLLYDLKNKEQQATQYEQTKRAQFQQAQSKYSQFDQIRSALHQTLENAQQEIVRNESLAKLGEPQQYFNNNFIVENDQKYRTIKKGAALQESDVSSEMRMMLLQALAIQSFLSEASI